MTPRHHLPDPILMGYAVGAVPEGTAVLVATHLALCPGCRDRVSGLESVGGAMLEDLAGAAVDEAVYDEILGKLDEAAPKLVHPMPDAAPLTSGVLPNQLTVPEPLRSLVSQSTGKWRTVIPGKVRRMDLSVDLGGKPLRLMRVSPGFGVPNHTHSGLELNLILSGGFHDRGKEFLRGDISANDVDDTHSFNIDAGEDCVILIANEGDLIPLGWWARIANWLSGGL